MLKNLKKYFSIAKTGLSLLSICIAIYFFYKNQKKDLELKSKNAELIVKTQETIQYKDDLGRTITKVYEYSKSIEQLKTSKDAIEQRLASELKKSNIKDRQISGLVYAYTESKDVLEGVYRDSLNYKIDSITKFNNLRKIEFQENSKVIDFIDSFIVAKVTLSNPPKLEYAKKEELFLTSTTERPKSNFFFFRWIGLSFRKKESFIQAKSSDPNTKVNILRQIIINK